MRERLHVLVAAPPAVHVPADLERHAGAADLLELRLDLLDLPGPEASASALAAALRSWIAAAPRPVLATVRSADQGGRFEGTPAQAAALLRAAAEAGAAWLDVEADVLPRLGALPPHIRIVASAHGAEAAAPRNAGAVHAVKVARPVADAEGWRALLAEDQASGRGRFLVPYGPLGAARGAFVGARRPGLLFGGIDAASAVVPGQPSLAELLDELRAGEVESDAELYGLVGVPPSRSPSPALHNAVFRAQARRALYIPLDGMDLAAAMQLPLRGVSVTHPYKSAATAVGHLGEDARASGSVNTLIRTDEGWRGENTDADALRAHLSRADGQKPGAFVHGAGGFARTAVVVLRELGYEPRIGARSSQKATAVATRLGVPSVDADYERRVDDSVVVNATPAGAAGDEPAFLLGADLAGLTILDAPYADAGRRTGVAARALRSGAARLIDGHALLRAQALGQARLFAGRMALPREVERVLSLALAPPPALVLVGARGAGKTTVGRLVARALGRPFVDLDDEVLRATGRPPADWIERDGWESFRSVETDMLVRALARRGVVLATGGGVVEHTGSLDLLQAHAPVVYLRAPAEVLAGRVAGDGVARPRWPGTESTLEEARLLIARRDAAWCAIADHRVDADASASRVARIVVDCWGEHDEQA